MALLSRKADYALLILSYLARKDEGGNARAIADQFQLSRSFVANILKELNHTGFVSSTRGKYGGYVLDDKASQRTLAQLLESLDDGFQLTLCNQGTHTANSVQPTTCDVEHVCTVKGPMHEIHRRIMDVLRGVTLGELLRTESPLQPALAILTRPSPSEPKPTPA
jgi:Rrf2 family protein